jgi:hypothetical protein
MDLTLLHLFTAEEILGRLAARGTTGALHVFTPKESANIYFQEGLIVGAVKGLVEGEDVVKQVLGWSDARFIWQGEVAPAALGKPVQIKFDDLLARHQAGPSVEIGGKTLSETPSKKVAIEKAVIAKAIPIEQEAPPLPLPKAARTGQMEGQAQPGNLSAPKVLTATKQINPSANARISHEEALLKKHPLILLVAEGETIDSPPMRLTQLSSLIGRNPACDFTLDHTSVSRQHCLLQITDRGLHVKDLGTTNGTKVNGIVLTEGYINVGDTLSIGNVSFVLEKDDSGVIS